MQFLPDVLKSLSEQTFHDFSVLVIDNASTDGVAEFLRQEYPQMTLLRNPRNLGFSAAHNQGIRYALERWNPEEYSDRFVLVTNPDLLFAPTCLAELMKAVDTHPEVGSFGPKLRRAFGENQHDEVLQKTVKSNLIDSTGLHAHKNRIFTDRGAGEMDTGQYDDKQEVFGVSGALACYRVSALQDVRFEDEFFDHDFFAYKEDVDLAWRLQDAGWNARFVPQALAFHYRGMYGKEQMGIWEKMKNRRTKSTMRNYYSNRNHWLLIMKNERWINGLLSCWRVVPLEIGRLLYTILFELRNLRAFADAMRLFPRMMKKRVFGKALRQRRTKELRAWFV